MRCPLPDDRRFAILRTIVTDCVSTQEPVGRRTWWIGTSSVSSATVRNDMAVLEAEGYIAQPTQLRTGSPPTRIPAVFVNRISRSNCSHRPNAARSSRCSILSA